MRSVSNHQRVAAEMLGTAWLVLGGCGSAVLAAGFAPGGIGLLGVSLAFGLTVFTAAAALGHISGAHLNPAVTVGLACAGRLPWVQVPVYLIAQIAGGLLGAVIVWLIATGQPGYVLEASSFAVNGYGALSPGHYGLVAAFITEATLTFVFVLVILGTTHPEHGAGRLAPLAIGLCLTLIHLISIPVTNTSVNPARSTSQALLVQGEALAQLWLFWAAPLLGAVMAGAIYPIFFEEPRH